MQKNPAATWVKDVLIHKCFHLWFMGVIPFGLVFSCGFAVRYPFPEIRDEVPENFKFFNHGLPGLNGFGIGTR